jgi:uncharacterized delta-60 repeat protein
MKFFLLSGKRIESIRKAAIVAILVCNILPMPAKAAGGELDTSFGIDGKLVHDVSSLLPDLGPAIGAMVVLPNGKILMGGSSGFRFVLARYHPDGTIDTSFGIDGVTQVSDFRGADLDVMDDGRIVAAGTAFDPQFAFDFEVVRFNADGSLDSTFANNGRAFTDFSGMRDDGTAVAVQSDGKIVAGGFTTTPLAPPASHLDFALVRYNSNGTLDTGFGDGGKVITDVSGVGFPDNIWDLAIQSDGKYVAAGQSETIARVIDDPECGCPVTIARIDLAIARYDNDGSLDAGFGSGGKVAIQLTNPATDNPSTAQSVAIQRDGKIVAAGEGDGFGVVRLNEDGSLDSSFGNGGKVNTPFLTRGDRANAVILAPGGRIIVAGRVETGRADRDFGIAQYNKNGTLDSHFGEDGKVTTDIANFGDDVARSVARTRGGRILVGGFTPGPANPSGAAFAIVRYRPH